MVQFSDHQGGSGGNMHGFGCTTSVAQDLGDKTSIVSEKEAGRFFTINAYAHAQIDFLAIAADVA